MLLKMALASRWNCVKCSRANGVANTTTRHARLWAPSSYLYTTPDALLYVQVAKGVYDHLALRAIPREYRDALGAAGVLLQDLDGRKGRHHSSLWTSFGVAFPNLGPRVPGRYLDPQELRHDSIHVAAELMMGKTSVDALSRNQVSRF